ncbi:ABC transporter permease [Nonomuraea insulae]|uniref:Xylose transport system permease protein XylH n=1 Tax=Nonomuraea insulae TaxID=1616787 RepID=A0ABW1CK34_9ACTN
MEQLTQESTAVAGSDKGRPTHRPKTKIHVLDLALDNIVWILLVVFAVLANFMNPFFLSVANLQNVLVQATTLGFVAVAIALTLLLGEIDLSVIGILGFTGAVGAMVVNQGVPGPAAILLVVLLGAVIGLVNGLCIAKLRMNSLIETLAMGLALGGAVLAVTKGQTITISSQSYTFVGQGSIFGWPVMPLALVLLFVVIAVLLNRTPWGRRLYATGGNKRAAYAAGIRTDRQLISAYVVSGLLAGCGGWLATAYLSGVNSTVGSDLLLYAVAAPVIGGVSLFGGRGRVLGMLGGTLLLTVVQVGLQLVNISAYYVAMVGGAMIFLAVFVDAVRIRRRES